MSCYLVECKLWCCTCLMANHGTYPNKCNQSLVTAAFRAAKEKRHRYLTSLQAAANKWLFLFKLHHKYSPCWYTGLILRIIAFNKSQSHWPDRRGHCISDAKWQSALASEACACVNMQTWIFALYWMIFHMKDSKKHLPVTQSGWDETCSSSYRNVFYQCKCSSPATSPLLCSSVGEDLACPDVDLFSLLFVEAVSVWIWLCLRVIVLLGGEPSHSASTFFALILISIFSSLTFRSAALTPGLWGNGSLSIRCHLLH